MQTPENAALADYIGKSELLPKVTETFPTAESLNWFIRCHRAQLADAGALIVVTGRQRFHPALFGQAVVAIGRRNACGGVRG